MNSIPVQAYTLSCALGVGMADIQHAINSGITGLSDRSWPECDVPTWFGRVDAIDQESSPLAPEWESRNNRLAELGLRQDGFAEQAQAAIDRYGADRCAVIIGTSTSSIGRTESGFHTLDDNDRFAQEYRQPEIHNPHSPTAYVAATLGYRGPAATVSTACSSSAKVFASAARWLACDVADAIVVGGVDSLCLSVIYGFHALQLVSPELCRPFDHHRAGINLGEAAGFALLTRATTADSGLALVGYGESLDAYHMSSTHPEGLGARLAMEAAVKRSSITFADINYLNLHGTGTRGNDAVEGLICSKLFTPTTMMSATKGWTGHTLGAAGITEAVLCMDALKTGLIPGTVNTSVPEDTVADRLLLENRHVPIRHAMSNSFGFGGNNCSIIFKHGNS
jgi:3-oxoacyl-[acyl-carrier-protein] synthase I